ncbi:TPA: hypothetical protein U1Z30_001632, partial [Streptococcus suis]|nr:hypothetical protein [Streptococcus suis]
MKNITDTLVKIIYLNIIPSALLGVFQISSTIYTALFALVFAFQIFLISRTLGRNSIYLSRNQMYVLILIFAIQIISNLYSAAIYDNFNLNETLVIFSVTLNIYYFIICLFNVNIDM